MACGYSRGREYGVGSLARRGSSRGREDGVWLFARSRRWGWDLREVVKKVLNKCTVHELDIENKSATNAKRGRRTRAPALQID